MSPDDLLRSGQLNEAIQALVAEVRDQPSNLRRRTFLFELLSFAGQFERAEKQLNVLAQSNGDAELGTLLFRSALVAERKRQALFEPFQSPANDQNLPICRPGTLNGKPFRTLEDLDPRIGPRLEIFVAGEYLWLPFEHIGSIRIQSPRFLRDTLWASAIIQTGPTFQGQDLGEVLIPVLSPFSWKHENDEVKLGRLTEWEQDSNGLVPFGQKLLIIDDEETIPFLEIRELDFTAVASDKSLAYHQ